MSAPRLSSRLPPRVSFRAAHPGDVHAVVALVESAYRGEPSRAGWTTEADLLDGQRTDVDEVAELIRLESAQILLAFDGSRAADEPSLLGCVLVRAKGGATSHIGMFAVQPGLQSRGVGSAILAEAERVAAELQGARRVEMSVIVQRHELIAWYERRGYRVTGKREPFPYGDPRFGLPRREDLEFSVLEKPLSARRD